MGGEILIVPRAAFDLEEPWTAPAGCVPVRLRRSADASAPRLSTSVATWFDDDYLSVLFSAADDLVVASYRNHDDPLWEQDVVEVFLAPESRSRYFEIEVSPAGTTFDARIDSPDGVRATMRVDRSWDCPGLFPAVRSIIESGGAISLDLVVRIPFAALERQTPLNGETWRGNFYRIDRHPALGDEFTAWQPTGKTPPDFHVTAAFGTLQFRG